MEDEFDSNSGKIAGKSTISVESNGKIAGSRDTIVNLEKNKFHNQKELLVTRKDRITSATKEKGLKQLSQNFGDSDGDWQIIESKNLFELLYLDHSVIISVNPEIVKNNYSLLIDFWKEKKNLWESGSGQLRKSIEDRYHKINLENCVNRLDNAFSELSSIGKIDTYYNKLEKERLDLAKIILLKEFEKLTRDEDLSDTDFQILLEMKDEICLSEEEILSFLFEFLTDQNFIPTKREKGKGWVRVNEDFEGRNKGRIISFTWMTENKIKNQPPPIAIEITEGKYAESVEEIGEILFADEEQARKLIKKNILHNPVGVFSQPKAIAISDICDSKENEYLKYFRIIYKLNPQLPYRFQKKEYFDLKSLSSAFLDDQKQGKEHFKQGNIEIWLQETQKDNYQKLVKITHAAENTDLAFLELLYTFNPELPYCFSDNVLVKSPIELCNEINKSKENWIAGKKELYNSFILTWLKTIGNMSIVEKWNKVKDQYLERKDEGIELFLHLLNEKIESPLLELNVKAFSYPQIQSGESIVSAIVLSNKKRGFITGNLIFSKPINGVTLSSKKFSLNVAEGAPNYKVDLKIDSKNLLKGVDYKTDIQITTSDNSEIIIPVSFKIVFPKKAFIIELIKYSLLFAFFGLILRGIIYAFGFHNWLNTKYNFYLHPFDISWQEKPFIYYFPIILLLFILLVLAFTNFWNLIKRTLNLK